MIEGINLWVGVAIGCCVLFGYVATASVFMVRLSSMPKELRELKQDISTDMSAIRLDLGADISTIKEDVKVIVEAVAGMRVRMAEMKVQADADHSAIRRIQDSDLVDFRKQLQEVRGHGGGGT